MTSSRFSVATHVLAVLAHSHGTPVPSSELARSVNTSPEIIRQLLMKLRAAGLVTSKLGPHGGSLLARAPDAITLRDVWEATERACVVGTPRNEPSCECAVGRHISSVLGAIAERAQEAMFREFERVSVAAIARRISQRASAS